jgi:hypothetical protein
VRAKIATLALIAALVMLAAVTACIRVPVGEAASPITFTIRAFESPSAPSPLNEVRTGQIRAVFPKHWEARPLPSSVAQEGFVASPRVDRFERGAGTVQGIEAFWVDVAKLQIPSDYYYLAARGEALSALVTQNSCRAVRRDVLVDRPPDFTGQTWSPGDYVVSASGTCRVNERPMKWAYIVAAPGFGPVRQVGLPTSGLYVVVAVVSGPNAERLLKEMLEGAQFGGTPISQIVRAAGRIQ